KFRPIRPLMRIVTVSIGCPAVAAIFDCVGIRENSLFSCPTFHSAVMVGHRPDSGLSGVSAPVCHHCPPVSFWQNHFCFEKKCSMYICFLKWKSVNKPLQRFGSLGTFFRLACSKKFFEKRKKVNKIEK
ncbi:hypothetical protein, partial [Plesiomonas sp.]|uniref:hypothetical protein n=1 Tax=Plesiomonas sp. TaxID=2486279 RepID=UPI003F309753